MMPKRTQVARSDPRSKHDTRREARTSAARGKCRVVGIGASAGGLEAFSRLLNQLFPKLVARARRDEPLRVWVLGCATGQEAYSIAMAFVEASDTAASPPRLQIFATDINDALLDRARQGFYATGLMADVSPERRKRFFVAEEGGYRVNKALREMVIFARQNILSDPPFSHIDLITCRNLLIYLESGLQKRIFPSFHYALEPQGFLFLGASESIGAFTSLFEPVDNKNRIFAKKAGPSLAFQLPISKARVWSARSRALPAAVAKETAAEEAPEGLRVELNAQREADRITLGRCAPPGVLVDADGDVVQFRGATAAYLAPVAGRASFNVLKMAREGLMLPLRAALQQAKKVNRPVRKANVRLEEADRIHRVHLEVIPLRNLRERCYPREELLGKELWEIGLLKDEAASQAAVRELQERGFIRYEDLPLVSKTGERRDVEFVSNLYDEDGCQVIQCNIRDITERKEAEAVRLQAIEDLKAARNAAERSSRAKDDFLAALSHELRTPLTPVLLTAAALREDERLSPEVREQLAMIERNVALEAGMIDDLLDLTKVAHGKLQLRAQPCDAHQLIGFARDIVREEARAKGVIIEQALGAKYHHLVADPTRFQQVVWNLLRNAVKFTPAGGRISIHTANPPPEGAGERWLRIEVSDTGVGIAPANLSRIFLPFDQGGHEGDHRFGGMGLGLAIARAVVDLHGGRIHAESGGLDRGTKIIFELPDARDSSVVGSAPAAAADRSAGGGSNSGTSAPLRLLVVEDHESSLQALVHLLRRDGHEVVPASTVAQALVAAEGRTFDLLISDLGLPDGRGDELMERLYRASGLRGIALTGYGAEEDIARSRAAGFIAHLVKPVSIRDLRRVLAAVTPPGTSGHAPKNG